MKTGFIHGYPNKPGKKRYSYHGLVRDCLIQPNPDPFEDWPVNPPYGPEQHIDCFSVNRMGWYAQNSIYVNARNSIYGKRYGHRVGQMYAAYGNTYTVQRWGVCFDTTTIPGNASITRSILNCVIGQPPPVVSFDLVIRSGAPLYPHLVPELADFNYTNYSGNFGSRNTSENPIGYIPLNGAGIGLINRFGITKFALLSSRDIDLIAPIAGGEIVEINPLYDLTYLRVYYKLPI